MSRRLSIGGRPSALQDASALQNARSSRRMSVGGKDNYALLSEWRKQARDVPPGSKRSRSQENEAPPLPPKGPFVEAGESALEAYRRRKMQRSQESADDSSASLSVVSTPHRLGSSSRRQSSFYQPMRPAAASSRSSSPSLSQEAPGLSQLTTESEPIPHSKNVDAVEDAGLRSQIRELQLRIDILEKQKMDLNMTIAPLEERLRSKEDAWIKDQNRYLEEIDTLKAERQQDPGCAREHVDKERKDLQFQVRKASSSLTQQSDNSDRMWSHDLQDKLRSAEEEIAALRLDKVSIEKELHATKIELDSLYRSFEELQAEYEEVSQSTSENREAELKLEHLTTEHIATAAQLNAVCADLAATKARAEATITAKDEEHKKVVDELQFEMCVLKTRSANHESVEDLATGVEGDDDVAILRARIEEKDRRLADLESQLLQGETLRRQMHNQIQELRGNIRVFVRTRPFLPSDGDAVDAAIDVHPNGEQLALQDLRSADLHRFKFDKVFPPSSGQDHVFDEVSDFVQSALDGYNVCLFSYGQTGSGKTHTMQGSGNGVMRGIIPRAVEQILNQAKAMQLQRWQFSLSASFLEIYNENLNDLLLSKEEKSNKPAKLAIKRPREGKSYVEGLTEVPINTADTETGLSQLASLMKVAARARSVASTKMNAQSSRSHSVFMLKLHGYNDETGVSVSGELNLCDLAGSERLDRSGANADAKRLKETQAINKSLSCLGDVFNALSQGASHIPFRNSKLTYLLQDCLSGDGKALMFVNLSPTMASSGESLCSLRFAQRVNQVELGKATKNIEYNKG